jgi:2-polyprenyl-3-methyl-5-hydroxy-6-metoxy-1,4-benzoquinol methylase
VPSNVDRRQHWDDAYSTRGNEGVSWFEPEPTVSLELIRSLGVERSAAVVDVGGGASFLVDRLFEMGYTNVSVLDVSQVALAAGQQRLGGSTNVSWLHEDVLAWRPARQYGLWHDRAVFHFLTSRDEQCAYLESMESAITPGGSLVLATFASDGPEHCSGLPVTRYSAEELVDRLGPGFSLALSRRELHTTPGGAIQPFTWVAGTIGSG